MKDKFWSTPKGLSWFLLAIMVAVIATVLAFEHLGGFIPCKLCLEQRQPWYIGIVLMAVVVLSHPFNPPPWLRRGPARARCHLDGLFALLGNPPYRRGVAMVVRARRLRRGEK